MSLSGSTVGRSGGADATSGAWPGPPPRYTTRAPMAVDTAETMPPPITPNRLAPDSLIGSVIGSDAMMSADANPTPSAIASTRTDAPIQSKRSGGGDAIDVGLGPLLRPRVAVIGHHPAGGAYLDQVVARLVLRAHVAFRLKVGQPPGVGLVSLHQRVHGLVLRSGGWGRGRFRGPAALGVADHLAEPVVVHAGRRVDFPAGRPFGVLAHVVGGAGADQRGVDAGGDLLAGHGQRGGARVLYLEPVHARVARQAPPAPGAGVVGPARGDDIGLVGAAALAGLQHVRQRPGQVRAPVDDRPQTRGGARGGAGGVVVDRPAGIEARAAPGLPARALDHDQARGPEPLGDPGVHHRPASA